MVPVASIPAWRFWTSKVHRFRRENKKVQEPGGGRRRVGLNYRVSHLQQHWKVKKEKARTAKPRVNIGIECAHDTETTWAIQGSNQDTDNTEYPME